MTLNDYPISLYKMYRSLSENRSFDGSPIKKKIIDLMESFVKMEEPGYRKDIDCLNLAKIFLNEPYGFMGWDDVFFCPDHRFDDEKKGISYLRKCSNKEKMSNGALGCYYALGIHVPKDERKAKTLLSNTGTVQQYYVRIGDYLLGKDPAGAFRFYCLGEEKGEQKSAIMKGYCLLFGKGTPKDEKGGFNQLMEANYVYDQNPSCSYWMAYCYLRGIATRPDIQKAKESFRVCIERADRLDGLTKNDPMQLAKELA